MRVSPLAYVEFVGDPGAGLAGLPGPQVGPAHAATKKVAPATVNRSKIGLHAALEFLAWPR
jgi:hypothetical protein